MNFHARAKSIGNRGTVNKISISHGKSIGEMARNFACAEYVLCERYATIARDFANVSDHYYAVSTY